MINKISAYKKLVAKRKAYKFPEGLLNPSEVLNGIYDIEEHIGPWSAWQGNLDADILLVGQDWGSVDFFIECEGGHLDDSLTNRHLRELFQILGIDIGYPDHPNPDTPVFFTNAVLGLKKGSMTSNIKSSWLKNDAETFLKPTIDIIEPKIIITLGKKAYDALSNIYPVKKDVLKNLININPIELPDGMLLFAFYHCGGLGVASRNFELQKKDWESIKGHVPHILV